MDAFREHWPDAWPTLEDGLKELSEMLEPERICRAAVDEDGMTSLAGVNLYESLWEKIRDIRNLKRHPFEFYQKMGYVITGVVPDANGVGKPDILMAKKV